LLLESVTTAPPEGAGPLRVTVTVVDDPLATLLEGLMERAEIEACPAVKLEIEDQSPY
jgi:hypothetical protein